MGWSFLMGNARMAKNPATGRGITPKSGKRLNRPQAAAKKIAAMIRYIN